MKGSGLLIVISGFSGSGKGTIMKELIARYPEEYALSISATTRGPREGEEDGREYFFKTKEEFLSMIEKGELLEYAQYVENYYGTPKAYVQEQLNAKKNVILEIEIQGALKVKERFPETELIFLTPPSASELKERLVGRGTETMDVIEGRMKRAVEEAEFIDRYDHLIINDELERCVEEVHRVIQCARSRICSRKEFAQEIKEELSQLGKEK